MSSPSLVKLFETLQQHRLLGPDQLAQLTVLQPTPADPPALLSELQRRGWLTAWQAERLLQGHGYELVLGQYVLSQDGHLLRWDLERKAKRSDTALPEDVVGSALAGDGRHLAVANTAGTVYLLRLAEVSPEE
jgi:hypothetical protein